MPNSVESFWLNLICLTVCPPSMSCSGHAQKVFQTEHEQDPHSTTRFKFFMGGLLNCHLYIYHDTFCRAFLFAQVNLIEGSTSFITATVGLVWFFTGLLWEQNFIMLWEPQHNSFLRITRWHIKTFFP